MLSFQKIRNILFRIERVEKVDTLSGGKHNHCGKALFCVFPPAPPFQSKTSSARGFASAHCRFSLKESLRRHMSACVTIFYFLLIFDRLKPEQIVPAFCFAVINKFS